MSKETLSSIIQEITKMGEEKKSTINGDPTAELRKQDHIELAFRSQVSSLDIDGRFYYEPLLSGHPEDGSSLSTMFLGKELKYPVWISSMTGGTEWAAKINKNLARACKDFGLGIGLGSCRALLYSDEHFNDFNIREVLGEDRPLFANLGIAQVEEVIDRNHWDKVSSMIDKLRADGLIIHVNPLQEWLQPEGDRFRNPPIDTIKRALDSIAKPIIVKEVGQGMGPKSLRALLKLPIAALDFGASGGTNFSQLELLRSRPLLQKSYGPLSNIGHSALEMAEMVNQIVVDIGSELGCSQIIASGGIKNFLDGYYITEKIKLPSIYGQASSFLRYAQGDYSDLFQFVDSQLRGLKVAKTYLIAK